MTKKKNNFPLLLAIGVLISGITVACSVRNDGTPTNLIEREIFLNNIVGTYTVKNGAVITVHGDTMTMTTVATTISSTKVNGLYVLAISTTDGGQTIQNIDFTENKVINSSGQTDTQTLVVADTENASLSNVAINKTGLASTTISIVNGELTIFGTVIATKN